MRKLIVVIMLIMSSYCVIAQRTTDLGVQLAAATYWGDIEKVSRSKSITPVIGILGRYNFNRRLAIRGQLFTGNLKAEGFFTNANVWQPGAPRVADETYPADPEFDYNFNRSFQSVEALFEFNFRNYKLGRTKKENYTPFVSVGLGGFFSRASRRGTFILEPFETLPATATSPAEYAPFYPEGIPPKLSTYTDVLTLTIPVGVGLKFNITKRLGGVIEVVFRKTFADNIDNLDDPQRFKLPLDTNEPNYPGYPEKVSGTQLNNNDSYATLAVSVCYQLWSSKGNCAIYDKIKK